MDPSRDYGERSYLDVIAGVDIGEIIITPGANLPQLFDAETNRKIKGTGAPPRPDQTPQQYIASQFRKRGLDDMDAIYEVVASNALKGQDWHWVDLFLKYTVGKVGEVRGGDGMTDALNKLIDMIDKKNPEVREVEYIDGEWKSG